MGIELYWQYFEDLDKITQARNLIKTKKEPAPKKEHQYWRGNFRDYIKN